jgi:hypothetical protein
MIPQESFAAANKRTENVMAKMKGSKYKRKTGP